MATLLHIRSSIFGDNGQSAALAADFITQWKENNEGAEVITRDLITDPLPQLDADLVTALMSDAENRTGAQQKQVDLADQLLAEIRSADQLVVAVPMYNFGIPSQLKAWFDLIARNGVTFKYTDQGPVGLLQDKPVVLIATRGGQYREGGQDFQIPFVEQFFGFLGIKNVKVVYAEGLNMGDAIRSESLASAQAEMRA